MNSFNVYALTLYLSELEVLECGFVSQRVLGRGGSLVDQTSVAEAIAIVGKFAALSNTCDLSFMDACKSAAYQLAKNNPDVSTVATCLHALKRAVITVISNESFLLVKADRASFVDDDNLFGDAVTLAFESARQDIKEAGNCFAAECCTATVFHLMRAVEFAMRALARDRDVSFKDKPLDEKEWGQILSALESRISALRQAARTCWPSGEVRESQIRFYNEVIQELRSFNDAWRKHVSHADAAAFIAGIGTLVGD